MTPRKTPLTIAAAARGFSLIEALLGLVIVALVVWLALALLQQRRQRAAAERLGTELQAFAVEFRNHRQQQANWPPSTNGENAIPRGMENALKGTNWLNGTPVGGNYRWVAPDAANASAENAGRDWSDSGAIAVTAFSPSFPLTLSAVDLAAIDAKIDDGNLATGRFRTGFNGWPVLLVGEKH